MTQAKVVRMSGYLYQTKGKSKSFRLVSPIENVVDLKVNDKDLGLCQNLIWEEVDVIAEKEGQNLNLISITPKTNRSPLAG
jgi:hypothetical protein